MSSFLSSGPYPETGRVRKLRSNNPPLRLTSSRTGLTGEPDALDLRRIKAMKPRPRRSGGADHPFGDPVSECVLVDVEATRGLSHGQKVETYCIYIHTSSLA